MAFFHGVETIDAATGSNPVSTAATSVIALVGTAPKGPRNTLTLVSSPQDAEQFGGENFPLTINQSLKAIFAQTRAKVIVVNVFDPTTMKTSIVAEVANVYLGRARLNSPVLLSTPPVIQDETDTITYVAGTDYTIDEYGSISVIPTGDISEGDEIHVSYDTPDTSGLTASDFIGVTSPAKTGHKLFVDCLDQFGFSPKIFICPEYSALEQVAVEMDSQATAFRGIAYVDAPAGTSVATLNSNRTTTGTSFNTDSRRVVPVGPWVDIYGWDGTNDTIPLSSFAAGVTAKVDNEEGYWVSPSNHSVSGFISTEYPMAGTGINDQNSDANLLNASGIMTILKVGSSSRLWGNRSAAWPVDSDPRNFIPVQRVRDIVHESLELAKLPYIDRPINQATIDSIRATANGFVRTLIQRGALLPGSEVIYDAADNPASELALGHLTFQLVSMAPTPAERITYRSIMDINLLTNIS